MKRKPSPKKPKTPRRKKITVSLDARTLATLEVWGEALELDAGEVLSKLVRAGDRTLRIAERNWTYTPEQRRQYQPVWDEIDRRLGMVP